MPKQPEWVIQGKSIKQLIKELESFEDQNLLVEISFDDGETSKPISLVGKIDGKCMLLNCENSTE
ncbi:MULTISPECIES: hypothetical protein [Acinetobacter]|jgi:hypothetical protein|uniref:Uncharacterized protein n=3 Tax=Acinetobacter TaxID=469 RepID=V2U0Z2_9GAMM|nr:MULTISPECIES: hypothetical protein [Acinetobacter]ENV14671.1 hypothetical protein F965_00126 [Acinetobacter schindleri NIPH 900]EPF74555.1 hypothetical protein F956_00501 [Acinetobacter indicus ANC 4215]ESK47848.1 hypothetical protein P253_01865 [Acinetobacter indicus CIP 110367]MDM1286734.1 hypothetical protein [Acinetobacter indicus]MDM1492699.1 hypothetical protein [Acinetobacter indicus]